MSRDADTSRRQRGISWEMLNAYVDGELEAETSARVASAIADDPALARRAATLSRLRAASRCLGSAPARAPVPPPQSKRNLARRALAVAATLLAVIAFGALWIGTGGDRTGGTAFGAAVAAHRHWLDQDVAAQDDPASVQPAALQVGGFPDLSSAAMRLVYVAREPRDERGGIFAGYRGPNGCRIGLHIGPPLAGLSASVSAADHEDFSIRAWRTGKASVIVTARGVSTARLEQIAGLIARDMRDPRSAPEERLAEGPAAGPNCTG